jgi:hypothetical protein
MQLTRQIPSINDKPMNLTALSLVVFLLASLLSMMAAYDPERQTDDRRNSVVITLHEHASPTSDSSPDGSDLAIASVRACESHERPRLLHRAIIEISTPHPTCAFDARGPPAADASVS